MGGSAPLDPADVRFVAVVPLLATEDLCEERAVCSSTSILRSWLAFEDVPRTFLDIVTPDDDDEAIRCRPVLPWVLLDASMDACEVTEPDRGFEAAVEVDVVVRRAAVEGALCLSIESLPDFASC